MDKTCPAGRTQQCPLALLPTILPSLHLQPLNTRSVRHQRFEMCTHYNVRFDICDIFASYLIENFFAENVTLLVQISTCIIY